MASTNSITIFKDNECVIAAIYRDYDGYPDGHGVDLAELLIGRNDNIGSLAARVVSRLVAQADDVRLVPSEMMTGWGGYLYTISSVIGGHLIICIEHAGTLLFEGRLDKCLSFCKNQK